MVFLLANRRALFHFKECPVISQPNMLQHLQQPPAELQESLKALFTLKTAVTTTTKISSQNPRESTGLEAYF